LLTTFAWSFRSSADVQETQWAGVSSALKTNSVGWVKGAASGMIEFRAIIVTAFGHV
jgi:hypothetical protein